MASDRGSNRNRTSASTAKPILNREVLTPGREQTGVAVVLVAASALAFALAGSAFALWARSAAQCNHRHAVPAITVDADQTTAVEAAPECTSQLVEYKGISYFRLCPDPQVDIQPAHEVIVEEQEGMVVYRIVN